MNWPVVSLWSLLATLAWSAVLSGCGSGGSSARDASSEAAVEAVGDRALDSAEAATPHDDCFPPCIANARLDCWRPKVGTCSRQPGTDGTTYCYSNGVTEVVGPLNKVHTFSRAGRVCFSFEDVTAPAATTSEVVFRDATGTEIARGQHPLTTFQWSIACGGQSYSVDETAPVCATVGLSSCTIGVCP